LAKEELHLHGFAAISLQCEITWQATDRLALSFDPQYIRFPISEITSQIHGYSSTLTLSYTLTSELDFPLP
jgi:hypothetical protein